jgi:GntR family transcriptional regulator, rspAB operon transcriptional repressor
MMMKTRTDIMAATTSDDEDAPTQDRVIARLLTDDIVEWRIPPGSWLREREIAARFGVSHAPVREAFRHLSRIGLVKVVPWRGTYVIDIDEHAATEVYELWKSLFGVVCRLASQAMTDRDGRELMHRLVEYKDVTQRTENTFEHIRVSNRIGRFIAKRSNAPLALELLDRIALLARWQHNVYTNSYIETHGNEAGRRSAILYEKLCGHIVAREADAADMAARELIAVTQDSFAQALEEYKIRHAKTKPRDRRTRAP